MCVLVVNSSRSSLGYYFLLLAGSLCALCLFLLKSHLKDGASISRSERMDFSLKTVCQVPFPFSYKWGNRFSLHSLSFVAVLCHPLFYLFVLSIPLPMFCRLIKGKWEKDLFFLLLCLFCLGVYHRCSDRDMNSQRIAPSEIKTAILSAFPGKFYQDVWGVIFKQFLQAVQMTNHLQWPSKTLCIRP